MSIELRQDIPVLLCVISSFFLFVGTPLFVDWSERRRFDKRVQIAAAIAVGLLVCIGSLIYLIQLPRSSSFAAYLGISGGGIAYALGWLARNRIARRMAWNGWPKTYGLRIVLEDRIIALPAIIVSFAVGIAIYETVK